MCHGLLSVWQFVMPQKQMQLHSSYIQYRIKNIKNNVCIYVKKNSPQTFQIPTLKTLFP